MQTKLLITIIIFVFGQFAGIAGTKKKPISKYEIIIKTSEGTIRTWVPVEKIRIRPKLDRFYYGYYLNELFYKQGELQGKPVNGEFRRYDLKDNIIESGNCEYGLRVGLWKNITAGGAITETREYHKGLMYGHRIIYKNGKPDILEKYRKGRLIGKPKSLNSLIVPKKEDDKSGKKKNLFQRLKERIKRKNLKKPEVELTPESQKMGNATKALRSDKEKK